MTDVYRWQALFSKRLELSIVEAMKLFRSAGLEPILIKGWVAARNYPEGRIRTYSDLDFAVSSDQYPAAEALRKSDAAERFHIDLHCELRHLDSKPWKQIFHDSQLVSLEGYDVRIPSDEDHLRILATHWLNDRGESKEKLWDIYFAVANRPADFSWRECLEVVSSNRRTWVLMSIAAAHRYLNLPIDDLPFADEVRNLPEWLAASLESGWESGTQLRPLSMSWREPKELFTQLLLRIPPSPIQSAIENEGDLLQGPRRVYQLQSMGKRAQRSLEKLFQFVRGS